MTSPASQSKSSSPAFIESPRLLIRASAGTGKTFRLSSRFIALLQHASPEKILSSTFTRKAAGEILERILLRLARASTSAKSLKELAGSINSGDLTRDNCLQLLAQLTRQLHRVRISTLDSFFAQLAGSHALELGFPSGWRILDPVEVEDLRAQALEQMLLEGDQQELVQLMHMLDKGDSSRSVSGLMRQTIDDLYSVFVETSQSAWDCFPEHQFLSDGRRDELMQSLARVPVEQKRLQTAIAGDMAALQEGRWDDFLKKGLLPKVRSKDQTYYRIPIPPAVCELYLQLNEHGLALTSATWKQQTQAAWRLLNDFHTVFERLKQAAGGLEFGDVTRRLAKAQSQGSRRDIQFRMDGAIEHLLLDEFQDTSRPQWEVIRTFAEDACRHPQRSFFCVGDVKQAIYGWRGGEAAIFDTIEQQLFDLKSEPLNLSYRSSPVVIDAVNEAMTGLKQHDNLEDHADLLFQWCRDFPRHETSRKDLTGYVCLRTGPEAPETDDGPVSAREQKDQFWRYAAEYVADLTRQSPHATVGVLTRGNVAVGRMIFELNRLGIDASEEGGNPLTDAAGVQLILSLMRLADHPGNTIAACHVAESPLRGALEIPDFTDRARIVQFALQLRARLIEQGYGGVVHELALKLAHCCNRREYRRLIQLASLADRFDLLFSTLRPSEFVRYAESQRCQEPSSSQVRVMNIHQSKGLEFDIVVLPELATQLILPPRYVTRNSVPGGAPDLVALYRGEEFFNALGGDLLAARSQTRDRSLQEALCVLYVALTRAARSLHMLIPPKVSAKHPKSFAGLLRAALAPTVPLEPMKILWEIGDPDWSRQENAAAKYEGPVTKASPEPLPAIRFAPATSGRHRRRTAPTRQKGERAETFPGSVNPTGLHGTERGILFHSWLQQIIWIDQGLPDLDALRTLARVRLLPESELNIQLQLFEKYLRQKEIASLLSTEGQKARITEIAAQIGCSATNITCEVRTELPFIQQMPSGELMQGSIDRLVIFRSNGIPVAADVIDFKTDNAATARGTEQLTRYYRGQLRAYQTAASALLRISPQLVVPRLAFVINGRVVNVN